MFAPHVAVDLFIVRTRFIRGMLKTTAAREVVICHLASSSDPLDLAFEPLGLESGCDLHYTRITCRLGGYVFSSDVRSDGTIGLSGYLVDCRICR